MKTLENIQERINYTNEAIKLSEEAAAKAMIEVSEKIKKNVGDPEYVSRWIENWMNEVNYINERVVELQKELLILNWVISQ